MLLSKAGVGAALTSVAVNAANITINIPAKKGGAVKYIEVGVYPVLESILCSGGLMTFHNTSDHWEPLELHTNGNTLITEGGGGQMTSKRFYVQKEVQGNCQITANVRPLDNQSQVFYCSITWELEGKPTEEHFCMAIAPLYSSAVSATARASPGNITIPGGLGGRAVYIHDLAQGVLLTAAWIGGLRELEAQGIDIKPCEKYVQGVSTIGASGGGATNIETSPYDFPVNANDVFTTYLTPVSATAQVCTTLLQWFRPARSRSAR